MRVRRAPRLPRSVVLPLTLVGAGLLVVALLALFVLPDREPPSRVVGVQVEDRLGGTLAVSWLAASDNVGVARYRVYRDGTEIATVLSPAYEDTDLPVDVSFEYRVAAEDEAGNLGPRSDAVRAASAPPIPLLTTLGWVNLAPSTWSLTVETASASVDLARFVVSLVTNTLDVIVSPRAIADLPATSGNATLSFSDVLPVGELGVGDAFVLSTTDTGIQYDLRVVYLPASEAVLFESIVTG